MPDARIGEVLGRLDEVTESGKRKGMECWTALCPAHGDRNPSLSISYTSDGVILLHCFAGCTFEEIVAALNMQPRYFFPGKPIPKSMTGSRRPQYFRKGGEQVPITNHYDYNDAEGNYLYTIARTSDKQFPAYQLRDGKRALWKRGDPEFYRLPEVIAAIRDGKTIYFVEGEKDAENLEALGLTATTKPGGANSKRWPKKPCTKFKGASVVFLPDNDEPGYSYAQAGAGRLVNCAAQVKVVPLPGLPTGGDISDWLENGGTLEELTEMIDETPPFEAPNNSDEQSNKEKPVTFKLPRIEAVGVPLRDKTELALRALEKANDPPSVFVRARRLTRVAWGEQDKPVVEEMTESMVRGVLARVADFTRENEFGPMPISPPKDIVQDLMALDAWPPIPALRGISETPILRTDGSLHQTPGYDPESLLYYAPSPNLDVPAIPDRPSDNDIAVSASLLNEIICDFPFDGAASKANTLALILTPVLRPMIPGPVPMAIIDKPQPGTGASLLAEVTAAVATGRSAGMVTAPTGRNAEEEWRKRIFSLLREGRTLIVFDNVSIRIWSDTLAAALTSYTFSDRILGQSRTDEVPQRATWLATGNNIALGGDLPRRCYWIRMDAKQSQPWTRKNFRHPHLVEWISDTRGAILGAMLTLARAWVVAGKPRPDDLPVLGGFNSWVDTIGGVLAVAGIKGFLANLTNMHSQVAEEDGEWIGFLEGWWEEFSDRPVTVVEVYKEIRNDGPLAECLPIALSDGPSGSDRHFTRRLGNALSKRNEKTFAGGWRIEKVGIRSGVATWRVTRGGGYADETLHPEMPAVTSSVAPSGGYGGYGATPVSGESEHDGMSKPEDDVKIRQATNPLNPLDHSQTPATRDFAALNTRDANPLKEDARASKPQETHKRKQRSQEKDSVPSTTRDQLTPDQRRQLEQYERAQF